MAGYGQALMEFRLLQKVSDALEKLWTNSLEPNRLCLGFAWIVAAA